MKTLTTYLFVVMTLLPFAALSQDTVNTAQLACATFKNGFLDSALVLINSALSAKNTPQRLVLKGDIEFNRKNYAAAARCYFNADKLRTGISGIKTAEAYALAGFIDSAFVALNAYCTTTDRISSAKISANLAFETLKTDLRWQTIENQKDINDALKQLETAEHLINTNRQGTAYEILNKVIKSHPSYHKAWYLRALTYQSDNNYKSAQSDIEHALKLRSKNSLYINTLAEILYAQQKYSKAVETWIEAIKIDEMKVENYLWVAKSLLIDKNYQGAEKYARLYLLMFNDNAEAISILSESLALQGDCMSALKVLNTANSKDAKFYRSRGIIYLNSETYQFAIDDFNRAIDLDCTLYDIYLHRGLAYYMLGNKDAAKNDWNLALKHRVYKANDYLEKYR